MLDGSDLFWGAVFPAVVAASALAMVGRVTGNAASAWRTAIVLGYVAGHWALDARAIGMAAALFKSYQPIEARDWLPLLILLAIVPDGLAYVTKQGPVWGWLLRIALCVFVPWRLLFGSVYLPISISSDFDFDLGGWSTGEATAWIGGIAGALLVGWQLARVQSSRAVDSPSGQPSGVLTRSLLVVLVVLGGAITVAMSAYLLGGQMLGVLTAALAGSGLASFFFYGFFSMKFFSSGRGPEAAAGPVVIAFGSLLVMGHFYAELKIEHAALLLIALVFALGWLPLPAKLSPRWQFICRSVLCLVTLAAALTLAGLDFAATQAEESHPYGNFLRNRSRVKNVHVIRVRA